MKKFLFKISFYLLIVLSICFLGQYFINNGLRNYYDDMYGDRNKIFSGQINADIIILGSSRAKVQVDPRIIESVTGFSCYNFGIMASRVFLEKFIWKAFLNHNRPPKIVIKNIDYFSLKSEGNIVYKETFLPYLSEPEAEILKEIDDKIWVEQIIPIYRYRGNREVVFTGLKSFFGIISEPTLYHYNGYSAVSNKWSEEFEEINTANMQIIPVAEELKYGFDYLKKLINDCITNNIQLVLVHMPMYIDLNQPQISEHTDSIFTAINKFVIDNNLEYWDYSKDSLSYNKKYFYNSLHLNKFGAEIFTKQLAKDLIDFIQKQKVNSSF